MTTCACEGQVVIPGEFICEASERRGGRGTYTRHGRVFSSLTGSLKIKGTDGSVEVVSFARKDGSMVVAPSVGSVVLGRVTNTNQNQAKVEVFSVDGTLIPVPFHGIIRKEDVRAAEKDTVEVFNSFRPGDVVRARIISLGDAQAYALSTAENEMGVITADSDGGARMVPASWREMVSPKTGERERRKVAKIVNAVMQ